MVWPITGPESYVEETLEVNQSRQVAMSLCEDRS
jgi:hypothetical protein